MSPLPSGTSCTGFRLRDVSASPRRTLISVWCSILWMATRNRETRSACGTVAGPGHRTAVGSVRENRCRMCPSLLVVSLGPRPCLDALNDFGLGIGVSVHVRPVAQREVCGWCACKRPCLVGPCAGGLKAAGSRRQQVRSPQARGHATAGSGAGTIGAGGVPVILDDVTSRLAPKTAIPPPPSKAELPAIVSRSSSRSTSVVRRAPPYQSAIDEVPSWRTLIHSG